jgi:hypothetical protein
LHEGAAGEKVPAGSAQETRVPLSATTSRITAAAAAAEAASGTRSVTATVRVGVSLPVGASRSSSKRSTSILGLAVVVGAQAGWQLPSQPHTSPACGQLSPAPPVQSKLQVPVDVEQ